MFALVLISEEFCKGAALKGSCRSLVVVCRGVDPRKLQTSAEVYSGTKTSSTSIEFVEVQKSKEVLHACRELQRCRPEQVSGLPGCLQK